MNRNSKRSHILTAAASIVKNHGVEKLTLEAVAKEAGVSKGGLLHHFPNKEALIKGMVEELTNDFIDEVNHKATTNAADSGKWIQAYIETTFDDLNSGNGISSALSAALFTNPDLLVNLQNQYAVWQQNMENDGIDPVSSTIARLAADGLWFTEIFGVGKLDDEIRSKVMMQLITMTR
ncbi:TetR/AcrR family transcriptional regulator [Paenibacillus oenotherae]|uniref:TetR/AcrR family transcriptional regulator n=1 Tax=Paenibacillus oenotherae TaxID=1435645 RepID=A0ABS7DA40_9BACL|nr:TetR/AcrR family transcriptional regulator [Paenibacillus oenotherae]